MPAEHLQLRVHGQQRIDPPGMHLQIPEFAQSLQLFPHGPTAGLTHPRGQEFRQQFQSRQQPAGLHPQPVDIPHRG